MNIFVFCLGLAIGFFWFNTLYAGISIALFLLFLFRIIFKSNDILVFREWCLLLYTLNYLVSPLMVYDLPQESVVYGMKIPAGDYFELALPGFFCFWIGMYLIPNKLFKLKYTLINKVASVNKEYLKRLLIVSFLLNFFSNYLPGELSYFVYLFSLVRFVCAFSLYSIDTRLWYWPTFVLVFDLFSSMLRGMYHDIIMWIIFFAIFYVYFSKPALGLKIAGFASLIFLVLFIQVLKGRYRGEVWYGSESASLSTITNISSEIATENVILSDDNYYSSLNRGNQAWIFASTIDNMNRNRNFQSLDVVGKYFEAALLPRFLAPNKIKSGDKSIFNEFSGHQINEDTSMGLGIFADGYIAFGSFGVYLFGFGLGLLFSVVFKIVEKWSQISPFFGLLLLPILNYAVRPDCELQTTLNQIIKGLFLFGFFVHFTKLRFTLEPIFESRLIKSLGK